MATVDPVVIDENCLQPFYVLHRASPVQKISGKAKRKIDLSHKGASKSNHGTAEVLDCLELRLQNFRLYWSKIEAIIKEVLRNINSDEFEKIDHWIRQSFDAISSCTVSDPTLVTSSYPLLVANHHASSKLLFTGLVCTKNVDFVDDILTFEELAQYLKSRGYHVANLSSLDFSLKNGISGCLRNLLQQFLTVGIDAADISALASWYWEQDSCKNPVIVIIDGLERCCNSVLSDFIVMLSEWSIKIPIILIFGVTTTVDALRDMLPSFLLQYLSPSKFVLESPTKRMDAVIASVLVKHGACFSLGYEVATFLRNYFLRNDGTLTAFIRALKMASVQHFILDASSPETLRIVQKQYPQDLSHGSSAQLQERIIKEAFGLPSQPRNNQADPDGDIGHGLCEMQKHCNLWSSLVMCLYQVVKYNKANLLDVYCEALDPQPHKSGKSSEQFVLEVDGSISSSTLCLFRQHSCLQKCGSICQVIHGLRNLAPMELYDLLSKWANLTRGIQEANEKIKDLKASMSSEDIKVLNMQPADISRKRPTRGNMNAEIGTGIFSEKAARLAGSIMREYMQPVECIPLHEVICFNSVDKLHSALMGDPRRRIQFDLLESQKFLKCSCCRKNGGGSVPSMHDTAIMYSLAHEHGEVINLHDWFQSFKATISASDIIATKKLKQTPLPKKRKPSVEPQKISDASIQARFCRAISELQITGLLRMPSKRRPDFVQRVAFGV